MLPISPSNLARRYLCPGSAAKEKDAPYTTSPAAERGNTLHEIMAEVVEKGYSQRLERGYLKPEDANAVRWCLDQIRPYLDEAEAAGGFILAEHKLDFSDLGMERGGTVDFAFVVPGVRIVFADYKFGLSHVDHPKFNWQFKPYGYGLWRDFGGTAITALKLQPEAEEGYRRQEYTFSPDELYEAAQAIRAIVTKAKAPGAPLVTGLHCRWCAAKDTCEARSGALQLLPRHVSVVSHLESLAPEARREFWEKTLVASEWLEGVKKTAEEWVLSGQGTIPGWEAGTGRPTREWKDEVSVLPELRRIAVDAEEDPEQFQEIKVVSPAQAEKVLGKKNFQELADQVTVRPGNPKLVRKKDE